MVEACMFYVKEMVLIVVRMAHDSVELICTNEWVLKKSGVKRELLETVRARKLAY